MFNRDHILYNYLPISLCNESLPKRTLKERLTQCRKQLPTLPERDDADAISIV